MPDNKCEWKPKYYPGDECREPPFDEKGLCILHSEREDKDKNDEFKKKVEERLRGKEKIDLRGCYFPKKFPADYFKGRPFVIPVDFSEATFSEANFGRAKFSQAADFGWVEFSQAANFCGAKFSEAYFGRAEFSKWAKFSEATFSKRAYFNEATFSEAAYFTGATFSEANFGEATFSGKTSFQNAVFSVSGRFFKATFEEVEFIGAEFKEVANFDQTNFNGKADFTWAEFRGWTFFYKNSKETREKLEKPLEAEIPASLKDKIEYDTHEKFLVFKGIMLEKEKEELLKLSQDDSYKRSIDKLFDKSNIVTPFKHTLFIGDVRFQQVDLSHCSFLHSNIDKVDFRYCEFNKDRPDPLFGIRWLGWLNRIIDHRRQNVLKDEIDADNDVGTGERAGTSPVPTEMRAGASPAPTKKGERTTGKEAEKEKAEAKVRREKYEPVRRLYLELKKNFEEKRDWNTAGDFHYGEMECRKKMHGWSTFEGILVNIYFWSSGYGERPLRASVILCIFVLFLFPLLLVGNDCWPYISGSQSFCFWNCVWAFYDSIKDSFRLATFTTVTKIGEQIKPDTGWDNVFLVLESIIVYVQILLLALALRRRVKR